MQDVRAPFDRALERARAAAYPPGEYVGQESFVRAGEVLALARAAGVGPGTSVLDLCCGAAGPGRLVTRELRCRYLGVDSSAGAVDLARDRAGTLDCRFEVAEVPPVPSGPFDVVLLLETMLAFPDKDALLREVSSALRAGGRFAFTVEEGVPLNEPEREVMPDADTVWLVPLAELLTALDRVGLAVRRVEDHSRAHLHVVEALLKAYAADSARIVAGVGDRALADLLAAHRLWADWLRRRRVRKLAVIAERRPARSRP